MNIRLQKRQTHFTKAFLNVALRQLAVALELLEDRIELVGQVFKHTIYPIGLVSS